MPAIARAVATLRFSAPDLEPDEISAELGVQPDWQQRKGERVLTRSGSRVAQFGLWRLKADETQPADLNRQVAQLLARLTPDVSAWTRLTGRYKADLFCGWFMSQSNEGEEISPTTLFELARRGVGLSLDVYSPDGDTSTSNPTHDS